MRLSYLAPLLAAAGVGLAGCQPSAPTGQVVAKVGKTEITYQELQAEMAGFNPPDAKTRKAAEAQALDVIIRRKLLADAASAAKIDRSPDFAIQKTRTDDTLLVQAWQKKLLADIPNPAQEQVRQYVAKHPELFADHKVYDVDQLRIAAGNDPKLVAELKPLNTLEDIQNLLVARNVRFETGKGTLDSLSMGPDAAAQISRLPPSEIFIFPVGNVLVANKITNVRPTPVPEATANGVAAQLVKQAQAQDVLQRVFNSAITNHPKIKVTYNAAYAPANTAGATAQKNATGAK